MIIFFSYIIYLNQHILLIGHFKYFSNINHLKLLSDFFLQSVLNPF